MADRSRDWFAEVVRSTPERLDLAALLIAAQATPGIDPERIVDAGLGELDRLAAQVPDGGRDDERLRVALGDFTGSDEDYLNLSSSLLPRVLRTRRGLPILLSILWTEVARRAGIDAYGVALPGHFIACVGNPATFRADAVDGSRVLVDPWRGGALVSYDRARDIVERAGFAFRRDMLAPADPRATIERVLANIRMWAGHELRATTRLWALDLGLLIPDPSPDLLRERGYALVQAGYPHLGARWLEEFADLVEDASASQAEDARAAAAAARAMLN